MGMTERFIALLPVAYFGLMCAGLVLASVFLYTGYLDGGQWVTLCSVLFAADRAADGLTRGLSK